jgi:hypothetical protein
MKISVDDEELFILSDIKKKVIMNDIHADVFEEDMKRRLQYILMHKYEQCYERLKLEWEPKLRQLGINSIPLDPDNFAQVVFSQASYKDRKARDAVR